MLSETESDKDIVLRSDTLAILNEFLLTQNNDEISEIISENWQVCYLF